MSSHRTYSSSAPNYDTRRPRRTYASPPPESYHGPDFERAGAQGKYWNSKGMRDVYHPFGELDDPIIARPGTYGLAHDFREPRLEHKYSDPYKKRPNPYTARTRADYDAYKGPSDSHGAIAKEVSAYKQIPLGNKVIPNNDHRRSLEKGKERSREGRIMSNLAAASRKGFDYKYPQAYENLSRVQSHIDEVEKDRGSSAKSRKHDGEIDQKFALLKQRMESLGIHYGSDSDDNAQKGRKR